MRIAKSACLIAFLSFISVCIPLSVAQEGASLGDVARRLRNEKSSRPAVSPVTRATAGAPAGKPTTSDKESVLLTAPGSANTIDEETVPYGKRIRDLFIAGKFAELDQIADAVRVSKARLVGSPWAIRVIYSVMDRPTEGNDDSSDADWDEHFALLKRWIASRPDSITARVALAESYEQFGWRARGSRYADSVSEGGWRLFNDRVQLALDTLNDPFFDKHKDPEWFLERQSIAKVQGAEAPERKAIFEKAVAFDPDYQYFYRTQAEMLLPKWYGNGTDAAEFAKLASDQIGGKKGDYIYYQIGAYIWCHCDNKTDYEAMDWARIKRGFQVENEMFGLSNFELNRMARMATLGDDAKYADELLTRIHDDWEPEVWTDRKTFDDTKAWAKSALQVATINEGMRSVSNNLKTDAGRDYFKKVGEVFAANYSEVVRKCSAGDGSNPLLLLIAKDGTVEKRYSAFMTPGGDCMITQLQNPTFPAPPQAPYWVVVNPKLQP